MNQLERDLQDNACERLRTWALDTQWRCNAAGIPDANRIAITFTGLTDALLSLSFALKISKEDLFIILSNAYDTKQRLTRSRRK